jgi:DNA-binding transcriptional LysR family regulator
MRLSSANGSSIVVTAKFVGTLPTSSGSWSGLLVRCEVSRCANCDAHSGRDTPVGGPSTRRRLSEQRAAPYIDLSIVKSERRELESALSAEALDVVVDVQLPLGEEIRRRRLCGERLGVVARPRHPPVSRGLNLDTYLAQEHILVTQRRRGLSAEDYELNRQNLRRRIRLRCQHYYTACQVVSGTNLILTMPERWASVMNAQLNNQLIAFPLDVTVFDSYIYWHANSENDSADAWLRQQMVESFTELTSLNERAN